MSDPAIEAAQRAWDSPYWHTYTACSEGSLAVAAAREALKPIRELHRPFTRDYPGGDGRTVCNHCLGPVNWPCTTAIYSYASDEVSQ